MAKDPWLNSGEGDDESWTSSDFLNNYDFMMGGKK